MGDPLRNIDGVAFEPVALRVTDPAISQWRWAALLTELSNLDSSVPWWLGDALVFGEHTWGKKYAEAQAATGRKLQTLKNYAWVAKAVPAKNRDPELPWSFHREVARLDASRQSEWLDRAKRDCWTIEDLRRHLTAAHNRDLGTPEFSPTAEDEQGTLDRLQHVCPACGHHFTA